MAEYHVSLICIISRLYCTTSSVPVLTSGKVIIQFSDSQIPAATSDDDFSYVVRFENITEQNSEKNGSASSPSCLLFCMYLNVLQKYKCVCAWGGGCKKFIPQDKCSISSNALTCK